jgi:hypothetical protein
MCRSWTLAMPDNVGVNRQRTDSRKCDREAAARVRQVSIEARLLLPRLRLELLEPVVDDY